MRRPSLACLAAAALAACADVTAPVSDFQLAWERWHGAGVTDYQYEAQILCFCGPMTTSPVIVTVAGGQTVSIVYADSLTPADTTFFADVRTMDALFERLRAILAQDPHWFQATYHPTYGYPITVNADPDAQIADEEIGYRITDFVLPTH